MVRGKVTCAHHAGVVGSECLEARRQTLTMQGSGAGGKQLMLG